MRRAVALIITTIGAALMLLAIIGHRALPVGPNEHGAAAARSLDELYRAALAGSPQALSPADRMQRLFDAAVARLPGDGVEYHSPLTNWLAWTAGLIHPEFAHMRSPDTVLRHGTTAFCSEVSYILLRLAMMAGIPARHVGLNGHVVMEAWYDDAWHLYDPDYGVVPHVNGRVLGVADLERSAALVQRAYGLDATSLVRIYTTQGDNTFMTIPAGSQFNWTSHILMWFEIATEYLKFILPMMMVALGLVLFPRQRLKA